MVVTLLLCQRKLVFCTLINNTTIDTAKRTTISIGFHKNIAKSWGATIRQYNVSGLQVENYG